MQRVGGSWRRIFPSGAGALVSPNQLSNLVYWGSPSKQVYSDGSQNFAHASTQYFSIASNSTLQTGGGDFSISLWVNLTDKLGVYVFFAKSVLNNAAHNYDYFIRYNSGTDRFQAFVTNGVTDYGVNADNFGSPTAGTWYFLTVTHDATAQTLKISVNNGTANSVSVPVTIQSTTQSFNIGADGGGGQTLNGNMDSVGWWKGHVLSSTEQTSLYNSGSGRVAADLSGLSITTPTSWWDCDDDTGLLFDYFGTNHLTGSTSRPTIAAGIAAGAARDYNHATHFNGTSQYLSVAHNALMDNLTAFSWNGWINFAAVPSYIASVGVLSQSGMWFLKLDTGNVLKAFVCNSLSDGGTNNGTSAAQVSLNAWHNVCMVYDGTQAGNSTRLKIYIDGVQDTGVTYAGTIPASMPSGSTGVMYLGALNSAGTIGQYANGTMDAQGYWSGYALTQSEITSLFNGGKARKYADLSGAGITAPTAFYNLDESGTGSRLDSTSNHLDLTNTGGATQTQGVNYVAGLVSKWLDQSVTGKTQSQATFAKRPTYESSGGNSDLVFDGSSTYLSTGDASLPSGASARTLGAWFNTTSSSVNALVIEAYGKAGTVNAMAAIYISNGNFRFSQWGSAFYTQNTYNDGNWHFGVYTYDGGTTHKLYIDGQPSAVNAGSNLTGSLNTVLNSTFMIGVEPDLAASTYFPGSLGNLYIFSRALSDLEVLKLYNYGRS